LADRDPIQSLDHSRQACADLFRSWLAPIETPPLATTGRVATA